MASFESLSSFQDRYLNAWFRLYASAVGSGASLDQAAFDEIFGGELEGLLRPGVLSHPARLRDVLRATAQALADRGTGLAELLAASSQADRAAAMALGPAYDAELARSMLGLDRARTRVYGQSYLENRVSTPRSCGTAARLATGGCRSSDDETSLAVHGVVGSSPQMRQVLAKVDDVVSDRCHALVWGEVGSGRTVVSRAIHSASTQQEPFVPVECSSIPFALAEQRIFGEGRVLSDELAGAAGRGTLQLRDVDALPPAVQERLAEVVAQRRKRTQPRVVATILSDSRTELHPALAQALTGSTIGVPPLRDHREDIPLLVDHFLNTFCSRNCGCILGVSDAAMEALIDAPWPGNAAQLRQVVEEAVNKGRSGWIQVEDLPAHIRPDSAGELPDLDGPTIPTLAEVEARLVRLALFQAGGNKVRAAKALGISRHKLYDRMRKLGIA